MLRTLLKELLDDPAIPSGWVQSGPEATLAPVIPMHLVLGEQVYKLFSMISVFGTAQDITADELWVESFFPMDEATAEQLQALAEAMA